MNPLTRRALALFDRVEHADVRALIDRLYNGERWPGLWVDLTRLEPRVDASVIALLTTLRYALKAETDPVWVKRAERSVARHEERRAA